MLNVNVTLDLHLSLELGLGFVVGVVSSPNLRRDLLESLQLAKGLAFRVNSDVCCPYERNFGPKDSEEKVMYKQLGPGYVCVGSAYERRCQWNQRHQMSLPLKLQAGYESPGVGVGNQTYVLCKSNMSP